MLVKREPSVDGGDAAGHPVLDQILFQGLPDLSHAKISKFNQLTQGNKRLGCGISLQLTGVSYSERRAVSGVLQSGFIYIVRYSSL